MYLYRVLYLLSILLVAVAILLIVPGGADLIDAAFPLLEYLDSPTAIFALLGGAVVGLLFARILQLLTTIRGQLAGIHDRVSDLSDYPL